MIRTYARCFSFAGLAAFIAFASLFPLVRVLADLEFLPKPELVADGGANKPQPLPEQVVVKPPRKKPRPAFRPRYAANPDRAFVALASIPRIGVPLKPDVVNLPEAIIPRMANLGKFDPSFVSEASIPYIGDYRRPGCCIVALATMPTMGFISVPYPTSIDQALVPPVRIPTRPAQVDLFTAAVPHFRLPSSPDASFASIAEPPFFAALFGEHTYLVELPRRLAANAFIPHNPFAPSFAYVDKAETSFEDFGKGRRSEPLSPLAGDNRKDLDKFIVSLARDHQDRVWIGTEDQGVWCFDPKAPADKQWHGFGVKDGIGDDNAYAIACDLQGRIWVGTLNHGVSVYNGAMWKNYDILSGPIGERIFALAVSPCDGDMWIASNAGLTRYSYRHDTWSHYTRAQGLPSDEASSMAFDKEGTLYVGTRCDGIAIATTNDDFKTWRNVRAPAEYRDRVPLVPRGSGLPTDLINCILAAKDGTVYAATTTGLAWSRDKGVSWEFTRGRDWAEKVRGLRGGAPLGWVETDGAEMVEDYLTTLAEDDAGLLWVGTRQSSYEIVDPHTRIHQRPTDSRERRNAANAISISAILPQEGKPTLIGQYLGGLVCAATYFVTTAAKDHFTMPDANVAVSLPKPAQAPTSAELRELIAEMEARQALPHDKSPVVALTSDWATQGAWIGRYGRYWICLCACVSPFDFVWGTGAKRVSYCAGLGPNHDTGDTIRRWVHWVHTDNSRSLELPATYLDSRVQKNLTTWEIDRRQSEWDDHGEAYPWNMEGPNLRCDLSVPDGQFILSLYNMNKDGHETVNRFRDYRVSIREQTAEETEETRSEGQPIELAHARCKDFWGGVYIRFLVHGPRLLRIVIDRNYSVNAILAGIALDRAQQFPAPYFGALDAVTNLDLTIGQDAEAINDEFCSVLDREDRTLAKKIYEMLDVARGSAAFSHDVERVLYTEAARWCLDAMRRHGRLRVREYCRLLGTCYFHLQMFPQWEEQQKALGLVTARRIERGLRWDGIDSLSADDDRRLVHAYRIEHATSSRHNR